MSVYDIVTERIIQELESGTVPWRKPWIGMKAAHNRITGKPYSLLNQMLLGKPGEWASFDQWISIGKTQGCHVHIKKGSKASVVVFFKMEEHEEEDGSKTKWPVLRYHKVFHIDQVEGVEPEKETLFPVPPNPDEESENLFSYYMRREGITYRESISDNAFYDPSADEIHLPDRRQFRTSDSFYETLWHEVIHSTGSAKRLDRPGAQKVSFGSRTYGIEELIAEMGSAFMLNMLGIETVETMHNNAAYIDSWIRAVREDHKMVVKAAMAAEKAVSFIKGTC